MNITIPKISEKTIILPKKADILRGILIILLARAEIFGMRPLGLAYAAIMPKECMYIAIIGIFAGNMDSYFLLIKYMLAFFINYILIQTKKCEDTVKKALSLMTAVIISGALSFVWTGLLPMGVIHLLGEVIFAGGAYYLFSKSKEKTTEGNIAKLIITGGVLNVLAMVTVPQTNINIGLFFAILLCTGLSYSLRPQEAVLASGIIGFLINMSSPFAMMYVGIMVISSFLSSTLTGFGKLGAAIGFLSGITAGTLYQGDMGGFDALTILSSLALFVAIPERIHGRISQFINVQTQSEPCESEVKSYIAKRLRIVANAVCNLADGICRAGSNYVQSDMPQEFSIIPARVCKGCSLCASCTDSGRIFENIKLLLRIMEEDGYADHTNMPPVFLQTCLRSESFLKEFCHAYELSKERRLLTSAAGVERGIMARQYDEISEVIDLISEEIMSKTQEADSSAVRYMPEIEFVQEAKKGEDVCGDTLMQFRAGNKYFVLLCDGMGQGEDAVAESGLVARLFKELVTAGFDKTKALGMINSALCLNADRESFSTADILEIDLESGHAEFLKVGSADSFIKRKDEITTVSSKSLPIGILEKIDAQEEKFRMKNGDMIIMVSDGVGEAGTGVLKNDWIKKIIKNPKNTQKEMCEKIMGGAKRRSKFSDDMSCVVIKIKRG